MINYIEYQCTFQIVNIYKGQSHYRNWNSLVDNIYVDCHGNICYYKSMLHVTYVIIEERCN